MDEKLAKFLKLVPGASWRMPPPVWNEQLRQALNENLVKVDFGGVLKLTIAGRGRLSDDTETSGI